MERPHNNEYAVFYENYIKMIGEEDALRALEEQMESTREFLISIPGEKASYRYAEGKWSVNDVIGHMIDSERIFGCRALRFARGDKTELPGFEQDDYVPAARADERVIKDMAEEFYHLRKSGLYMLKSFNEEELLRTGAANGYRVSVRALIYIMAGHERHHVNILKERYLS